MGRHRQSDYPGVVFQTQFTQLSEETVSLGVQTFEKVLDGAVIWKGNRTEVDAFEFADGVSVNELMYRRRI